MFEAHFFEIEDDVGNIFLDTRDGREFVRYTVDSDRADGEAFERRQEDSAEGVTDSNTVAGLEGTEFKFTE